MLNGIPIQMFASTMTNKARCVLANHSIGEWMSPRFESTWLTMPMFGSNIIRRMIPVTTPGSSHGTSMSERRKPLRGKRRVKNNAIKKPMLNCITIDPTMKIAVFHTTPGRSGLVTASR